MQGLPSKSLQGSGGRRQQSGSLGPKTGAVDAIAQQGMADMGEMDSDLVGAPGLQPAGEQAGDRGVIGSGIALQYLPMGDGLAAPHPDGHFVAGVRMAVDRLVDRTLGAVGDSPDESKVPSLKRP